MYLFDVHLLYLLPFIVQVTLRQAMLSTGLDFLLLRYLSVVWGNQMIKKYAEYAIISFYWVLHFKKLNEKSSYVGFIMFHVFER